MKKIISYMLIFTMLLTLFITPVYAVEGETAMEQNYTVVFEKGSSTDEIYGAKILRDYLEDITGAPVFLVDDSVDITGTAFYVKKGEDSSLPAGSYTLKEENGNLIIEGSGIRGMIYGVFGYLEKYCGCRWYTSALKVIPENKELKIEEGLEYSYKPYFEYTETDWVSPRDHEYSMANGLNGGNYRQLSHEEGGGVYYISGFCHTLTSQFCSKDKYFKDHPEYFAYREDKGERADTQLCLTNPEVLDIVTEEVLALCKEKHNPDESVQIISLTQADNENYCQCEKCKALDEANGSHAGTMITFANAVAEKVKEAGYDNIAIDTFAYTYTRKPPTQVKPLSNVIVRLCSIECCFSHALDDEECTENADFMKDLKAWGEICDRIYIWDYTTAYNYTLCLFPDFDVIQRNVQLFYENNAKGVYEEGNYYMAACDGEFGELRSYLLSKLMQDPYMDFEAEKEGFLKAYYSEGWDEINEFLALTGKRAGEKDMHLGIFYSPDEILTNLTDEDIEKCDALWEKAKSEVTDETVKARLLRSEICWTYWKFGNKKGEFSKENKLRYRVTKTDNLWKTLDDFGITKTGESTGMPKLTSVKVFSAVEHTKEKYDKDVLHIILEPGAKFIAWICRKLAE